VAQTELGIDPARDFTVTGGLTFAGGPYNSYCMHALARSVELIREGATSALLSGNGGFYTKHSFALLGREPAAGGFRCDRPQDDVDVLARRPIADRPPAAGTVETYTVAFDPSGEPERGIVSVLDDDEARTWTNTRDPETIGRLLDHDCCGRPATVRSAGPKTAPEMRFT
jgi:acetyl-CoA C-acetyltransferase